MALKHANDETFDSMVQNGLTLVDFWASWCGPCQMFGPIFENVSDDEPDVNFVKFEIDKVVLYLFMFEGGNSSHFLEHC